MDDFYTAIELADLLKISAPTLARWRGAGQGPPFVQLEGTIRYPREGVDRWLAERTRAGSAPT